MTDLAVVLVMDWSPAVTRVGTSLGGSTPPHGTVGGTHGRSATVHGRSHGRDRPGGLMAAAIDRAGARWGVALVHQGGNPEPRPKPCKACGGRYKARTMKVKGIALGKCVMMHRFR